MRMLVLLIGLVASPALSETLVAARAIRSQAVIGPQDIGVVPGTVPGALSDPVDAVGMEARVMLYPGRPIRPGDVGPPALIERNQIVTLLYANGGLTIVADGRALGRAAAGERVRAMNLASRTTVTGRVTSDGRIVVGTNGRREIAQ